ncbi:probable ATP-dependent RNA helicase ddx20 [Ylistrum balloti]|uniref:probable ATP-dependent RNA helicase ddx20 n=1 Tax=Ylistrum balloti TaxID=509963 RepID=UPI0029057D69|nr:probable ATP-dependent RNA helicase ddx20 [Ylistrum balloti]
MTETVVAHNIGEKKRTNDVLISDNIDFAGLLLSNPVLQGLKSSGFERPSPIQLKAIPLGRCGLDLIVQAKSGTGKTCVFSVVALEGLQTASYALQVLVLAPTREIAIQIWEVIRGIGRNVSHLSCQTFIGGMPLQEDRQKLKKCHIAVGTPGRIKQLIENGMMSTDSIRMFILDEADKLLEEGFQEQINWIYSSLPENKQMLALSATYPEYLALHLTAYMRNPTFLRLNISDPALLGINQYFRSVPYHPMPHKQFENKTKVVTEILSSVNFQQCLIFSNLQTRAQNMADSLTSLGWPTACIAGCLDQKDRNEAMSKLKTYKCRVLISTDLTSRGIDADKVDLVINLDIPKDHETYLHRIGRAGRFGTFGAAVTIISQGQEELDLQSVEGRCNTHISPLPYPIPEDLPKSECKITIDDVVSSKQIITSPKKGNTFLQKKTNNRRNKNKQDKDSSFEKKTKEKTWQQVESEETDGAMLTSEVTDGAMLTSEETDGAMLTSEETDGAMLTSEVTDGAMLTSEETDGAMLTSEVTDGSQLNSDNLSGDSSLQNGVTSIDPMETVNDTESDLNIARSTETVPNSTEKIGDNSEKQKVHDTALTKHEKESVDVKTQNQNLKNFVVENSNQNSISVSANGNSMVCTNVRPQIPSFKHSVDYNPVSNPHTYESAKLDLEVYKNSLGNDKTAGAYNRQFKVKVASTAHHSVDPTVKQDLLKKISLVLHNPESNPLRVSERVMTADVTDSVTDKELTMKPLSVLIYNNEREKQNSSHDKDEKQCDSGLLTFKQVKETSHQTPGAVRDSNTVQKQFVQDSDTVRKQVQGSNTARKQVQESNTARKPVQESNTARKPVQGSNTARKQVQESNTARKPVQESNTARKPVQNSYTVQNSVKDSNSLWKRPGLESDTSRKQHDQGRSTAGDHASTRSSVSGSISEIHPNAELSQIPGAQQAKQNKNKNQEKKSVICKTKSPDKATYKSKSSVTRTTSESCDIPAVGSQEPSLALMTAIANVMKNLLIHEKCNDEQLEEKVLKFLKKSLQADRMKNDVREVKEESDISETDSSSDSESSGEESDDERTQVEEDGPLEDHHYQKFLQGEGYRNETEWDECIEHSDDEDEDYTEYEPYQGNPKVSEFSPQYPHWNTWGYPYHVSVPPCYYPYPVYWYYPMYASYLPLEYQPWGSNTQTKQYLQTVRNNQAQYIHQMLHKT